MSQRLVVIAILVVCAPVVALAQSIIGTWSITARSNLSPLQTYPYYPGSQYGTVSPGTSFVTFTANGHFRRIDYILNGMTEHIGRYEWDGQTLVYTVDDWRDTMAQTCPDCPPRAKESDPAYHRRNQTRAVLVSPYELELNGEIWHRQQ